MADVNHWLLATLLLLPPLAVPLLVGTRDGSGNDRLVAVQVAAPLAAFILALMTFAFDQSSFIDVALCLTLLTVPGTYLYTLFMERWL